MKQQGELFSDRTYDDFSVLLARRFGTVLNGIVSEEVFPPYLILALDNTDTRRFDITNDDGPVSTVDYDLGVLGAGVTRWRRVNVGGDTLLSGFLRGFPLLVDSEGGEVTPAVQTFDNYHDLVATTTAVPISTIREIHMTPPGHSELIAELHLLQSGFAEVSNKFTIPVIQRTDGSETTRPAEIEDLERAIRELPGNIIEVVNEGFGSVASRFVQRTSSL